MVFREIPPEAQKADQPQSPHRTAGRRPEELRQRRAGLVSADPADTPKVQESAEVYLHWQRRRLTDPASLADVLRVVLRFFSRRTEKNQGPWPYHDLHLGDIVQEPALLQRFEDWMAERGVSGSTRNHYRSAVSGLFRLATHPQFRGRTGIQRTRWPASGATRASGVRSRSAPSSCAPG
ncbi:MAG TPA: hypothetical protein VF198_12090 [Vicinamibacterales bacterium]